MADLGNLGPTGDPTELNVDYNDTGTAPYYDEIQTKDDSNVITENTSSTSNREHGYHFPNMPADFSEMDTIYVNTRYRVNGAQTNMTRSLYVKITTDEVTPVDLTTEATIEEAITSETLSDSGPIQLTISGTPTKAQWDNACVYWRLRVVRSKGGSNNGIEIDWSEVTGTYTTTGPAVPPLLGRREIIRI